MTAVLRILRYRLTSDASVATVGQYICFAAAPALLIIAIRGITRMATTPAELVIGVLASSAVALLIVILGLVLPLAQQKTFAVVQERADQAE